MIKNILYRVLYLLRIGPGWNVEDQDGIAGKDFGPNWIRGLLFYLYRVKWCRDEYVRVEYFFEYVHYAEVEKGLCIKLMMDNQKDK